MDKRYAVVVARLADALNTDVQVIGALLDGEVEGDIMIAWPTGAMSILSSAEVLEELRTCRKAIERVGVEVVRHEENRRRVEAHNARMSQRGPQTPKPKMRFHLYRLWGIDGRLLYIGITRNLDGRIKGHNRRWGDVIGSVTSEEFSSHRAVLEAEEIAIREENPPFNFEHVG